MLVNDGTASQAEAGGLAVEMANGMKLVGSRTAGQDGSVTFFSIPGGIRVSFSGTEFRHADGHQLQRVGLQPDLVVQPTIAGIGAGRDEVLERATPYMNELTVQPAK